MKKILLIGSGSLLAAMAALAQQPPPTVSITGNSATVSCPAFPVPCTPETPAWKAAPVGNQAASFRVSFDITPGAAAIDSVTGLSHGAATDYTSLAAAVRFNTTNTIDARNGGAFAALSVIPYVAGTKYSFVLDVNVAAKTYSATVNGVPLAANYAFRTEQAAVAALDTLASSTATGAASLCNVLVALAPPVVTPPVAAPHTVALAWLSALTSFNVYRSGTSGSGYVRLNAAPLSAKSYTDASVTNGQTYFFVVTALNTAGQESPFSTEVSALIPLK